MYLYVHSYGTAQFKTSLNMRVATTRLNKFLKMHDVWLACAQQIDDIEMYACTQDTLVFAMYIMVYTNSMCVSLFCTN